MNKLDRYDSLFQFYGSTVVLDWRWLKAQGIAESGLNPQAVSPVGAMGLTQFMPATWAEWRKRLHHDDADPFNPEHAIKFQAHYMAWLSGLLNGNWEKCLAAYNWGIGNVIKAVSTQNWKAGLPDETRNYLVRVKTHHDQIVALQAV